MPHRGIIPKILDQIITILEYLERQVAQNNRPLYPKVAQNISKVAHNYWPLAFQVDRIWSFLIYTIFDPLQGGCEETRPKDG